MSRSSLGVVSELLDDPLQVRSVQPGQGPIEVVHDPELDPVRVEKGFKHPGHFEPQGPAGVEHGLGGLPPRGRGDAADLEDGPNAFLGQDVTMNGKRYRQAEIDQHFAIRDRLAAVVAREASGGGLAVNFGMLRRG